LAPRRAPSFSSLALRSKSSEVLRPPLESSLHAAVAVVHEPVAVGTRVRRLLERVESEIGPQ
jgi:hypothetical protein